MTTALLGLYWTITSNLVIGYEYYCADNTSELAAYEEYMDILQHEGVTYIIKYRPTSCGEA